MPNLHLTFYSHTVLVVLVVAFCGFVAAITADHSGYSDDITKIFHWLSNGAAAVFGLFPVVMVVFAWINYPTDDSDMGFPPPMTDGSTTPHTFHEAVWIAVVMLVAYGGARFFVSSRR